MVRSQLALLGRQDPALPLRPGDHPLDRLVELRHPDPRLPPPYREQSRLVDHVGEIPPADPRGLAGQHIQIRVVTDRLATRVHIEDRPPPLRVRVVDYEPAV